jgi:hypothetical protein
MKKLLVILQNAYGVEEGYVPSFDKESFQNCHTGRRLRNAIPMGLDVNIINASPQVGEEASSCFDPDIGYVSSKVEEISPDIILACGVNAKKAIKQVEVDVPVLEMPHPAFRGLTNKTLYDIMEEIQKFAQE